MTQLSVFSNGAIQVTSSMRLFNGLSDYQADDPLGAPYTDKSFYPRNWPNRPPVPEVRRFKYSGNQPLFLTEGIEWMWFYAFWLRNPSWSEAMAKEMFRRHTRDDAGFTNKAGSDSRYSFVLGTNKGTNPMQLLGIVCPGGNTFRPTGSAAAHKKDQMCEAVWNLDYDWLALNLAKSHAREFAASLPAWLNHTAKIAHPVKIGAPMAGAPNGVFKVTNWDGDFPVPLIAAEGRREVVDGFACRENWLQQNRLSEL